MTQFILDSAGDVNGVAFSDLDDFTRAYIECIFFTNNEPSTTRETHSEEDVHEGRISELPGDYGFSDLDGDALAEIIADCAAFQKTPEWRTALAAFESDPEPFAEVTCDGGIEQQGGHDFWLTRCGHGAGFWEDEWPQPHRDALSALCGWRKQFENRDVMRGDDGKVYLA